MSHSIDRNHLHALHEISYFGAETRIWLVLRELFVQDVPRVHATFFVAEKRRACTGRRPCMPARQAPIAAAKVPLRTSSSPPAKWNNTDACLRERWSLWLLHTTFYLEH
jgi:hypothetical protein